MRPTFDTAAQIAARQHGRIACRQLLKAGIDRDRIKRWLADGRLHAVHEGVYAVGHEAPSLLGEYMGAALAGGAGAAVTHQAAGHLLRLLAGEPPRPEVTVPTTAGRSRPGIVIHRVRALDRRDVASFRGIPITTVPRTLLDLAPALAPDELAQACHEAWVKYRTRPESIEACIARNPTKKGIARLRIAMGSDVTLSALERGFLRLLRQYGLPKPRTNIDVSGDKVDCHWPGLGLTIELLSYRYHASRHAFEQDVARRRRSNHLAYTWGDVFERSAATAGELSRLLGTGASPRTAS